jgi:hypothetical protein
MTVSSLPVALCLLMLLFITNASAFQLSPSSHSTTSQATSSSLNLFGKKKQEPPKPVVVEEPKKKPFLLFLGRPQYDWSKKRPMTDEEMANRSAKPFEWNAPKKKSN